MARKYKQRAARRGRARQRGQVLAMMLLALPLLVGLIFYVYNTGDVVNRRLSLQSSADSAAISGGTWLARSANVTAMNNVEMSRLLAADCVLDAMPLATEMALGEVTSWEQCLANQLQRPMPQGAAGQYVKDGLESLRQRMATQRDVLRPVDATINRNVFNMEATTHWPNGTIWQAMLALDDLSGTTLSSAGKLAQANAKAYGDANGTPSSFVVPTLPVIPAVRGTLDDFGATLKMQEAVQSETAAMQPSGEGGAIPDFMYPHRLGPFARLFRWRHELRKSTGAVWIPPTADWGQMKRGQPGVNLGGRSVGSSVVGSSGRPGYWQSTGSEVLGYTTYGPMRWMFDRLDWWANDHWGWNDSGRWLRPGQLSDTYFYRYIVDLSRIKLNYLLPVGVGKQPVLYPYPSYVTDYPQARALAANPNVRIRQTMFYKVQFVSSAPPSDAGFLNAGTFRTNGKYPIATWTPGWVDPTRWRTAVQVADYIWKDDWTYQIVQDPGIGLFPKGNDPTTGQPIFQTVYVSDWYVFGGIDVGGDAQISNPGDWSRTDNLPAAWKLDTREGDYDPISPNPDEGFRREYFSFLGVSLNGNAAKFWPARFNLDSTDRMMAVAQVKVFNNKSFDLWTQDWQVQLTPVSKWDDWLKKVTQSKGDVSMQNGVSQADLQSTVDLMNSMPLEVIEQYMKH